MTSELVATATYRFGRSYGETATVTSEFVTGIAGVRDSYTFRVAAADTRVLEERDSDSMWCGAFDVEVRATATDVASLDPDEALALTAQIARDVFTRLVLCAANLGFPGSTPNRESFKVTSDGQTAPVDHMKHRDLNAVMIVGHPVALPSDLRDAATADNPPSRARMMAAEAGYQVMFNPNASQVTALIVAASACEIAAHECVRRHASAELGRLSSYLLPKRDQAKISPKAVIDELIPVLTGQRLADEDSALWGRVRSLLGARDEAVHQGTLPSGCEPARLVHAAAQFVEWAENLS